MRQQAREIGERIIGPGFGDLFVALVQQESGFQNVTSPAGAMGYAQLMPGTAAELGVSNPWDPIENMTGGARYLRRMLDYFDGDVWKAVASYNAGPGRVENEAKARGANWQQGLPAETKLYLDILGEPIRRIASGGGGVALGGAITGASAGARPPTVAEVEAPPGALSRLGWHQPYWSIPEWVRSNAAEGQESVHQGSGGQPQQAPPQPPTIVDLLQALGAAQGGGVGGIGALLGVLGQMREHGMLSPPPAAPGGPAPQFQPAFPGTGEMQLHPAFPGTGEMQRLPMPLFPGGQDFNPWPLGPYTPPAGSIQDLLQSPAVDDLVMRGPLRSMANTPIQLYSSPITLGGMSW